MRTLVATVRYNIYEFCCFKIDYFQVGIFLIIFFLLGCTDYGEQISYWCEWVNARKIIQALEAHVLCPELVISFLETKLDNLNGAPLCFDVENSRRKYFHIGGFF